MVAEEVLHVHLRDLIETKHVQEVERLRVLGLIEVARALHLVSLGWRGRALPFFDALSSLLMMPRDSLLFLLHERLVHVAHKILDLLVAAAKDVEAVLLAYSTLHNLLLLILMLNLEQL